MKKFVYLCREFETLDVTLAYICYYVLADYRLLSNFRYYSNKTSTINKVSNIIELSEEYVFEIL